MCVRISTCYVIHGHMRIKDVLYSVVRWYTFRDDKTMQRYFLAPTTEQNYLKITLYLMAQVCSLAPSH